jgi:hypothetical protein
MDSKRKSEPGNQPSRRKLIAAGSALNAMTLLGPTAQFLAASAKSKEE